MYSYTQKILNFVEFQTNEIDEAQLSQDDNESLLRINAARLRYCVGQYQRCTEGLIPGLKYHHCGAALNYCNSQGIFDLPGGAANHNW